MDSFDDTHSVTLTSTTSGVSDRVLIPGQIVGGSYKLKSLLGKGGMGYVFCAEHIMFGHDYALKIVAPEILNEGTKKRFEAEGRSIAQLDHANIVKVYNMGLHEGDCPFYVMDLLEGVSLSDYLAVNQNLDFAAWLDIFLQITAGLGYAHGKGIVHRDVKPSNIILLAVKKGGYQVKIVDFGLAKVLSSSDQKSQSQTAVGAVLGSPLYMSPEQSLGEAVDMRSDIYSLGCTIFECLAGRPPYRGATLMKTLLMHQENAVPNISDMARGKSLPRGIDLLLAKMMAKRPENRYQSMEQAAHDLERIGQGKPVGMGTETVTNLTGLGPAANASLTTPSRNMSTAGDGEAQAGGGDPLEESIESYEPDKERGALLIKMIVLAAAFCCLSVGAFFLVPRLFGDKGISSGVQALKVEQEPGLLVMHDAMRKCANIVSTYETVGGVRKRIMLFPSVMIGQVFYDESVPDGRGGRKSVKITKIAKDRLVLPPNRDLGLAIGEGESRQVLFDSEVISKIGPGEFVKLHLKRHDNDILGYGTDRGVVQIVQIVDQWHDLRELSMSGLTYNREVVAAIDKIESLKYLVLGGGGWEGVDLDDLKCLPRMQFLFLEKAKNIGAACRSLAHSANIEGLGFCNCGTAVKDLKELRNCPRLTSLDIQEFDISSLVPAVTSISTLRAVAFKQGRLSDQEIATICACRNIGELALSNREYKLEEQKGLRARYQKVFFKNFGPPLVKAKDSELPINRNASKFLIEQTESKKFLDDGAIH